MSTSPYSIDLREKVIEYIKKGNSQKSASQIFGIHKNTINRWCIRYKLEGILAPKIRLGYKSKVDKNYERTNIIAGYVNHKLIAPMVFNGSCNTELFENWVAISDKRTYA